MMPTKRTIPLLCLAASLAGCPAATTSKGLEVIRPRDVSRASSKPEIEAIVDLGNPRLPRRGAVRGTTSDGTIVIGELLLVRGSGLGKQPRVSIGGRPAAVLGHTNGGGVLVRVPWGLDAGQVEVEVVHRLGRHASPVQVTRRGLVVTRGGVRVVDVTAKEEVVPGARLPIRGARHVVYSLDGSAAYVASDHGGKVVVSVIDMTADPPRVVTTDGAPGSRVLALEAAAQSIMGVLVTDTHIVYYDCRQVLQPAYYTPHPLPSELAKKGILGATVGGQGKRAALLLDDLNELAVLDMTEPTELRPHRLVEVLPEARLQVAAAVRSAPDGASMWVAASDTARSIAGGYQEASVTLLQFASAEGGERRLGVHETWELGDRLAITGAGVARGEPIPPGTAIRDQPSTSAVYLTTVPSELLKDGFVAFTGDGEWTGRVLRTSLGEQEPKTVAQGRWLLSSVDVVGKTQIYLALGARVGAKGKLERIIVHGRAWRGGAPRVVTLGPVDRAALGRSPLWLGEIRVQP